MRPSLKINNIFLNKIKGTTNNSCSNCIYFVAPFAVIKDNNLNNSGIDDFSRCRKIMYTNVETGDIDLSFTKMNRQFDYLCGPGAKYKRTSYENYSIDKDKLILYPIKLN
jgi:hypothetical protein